MILAGMKWHLELITLGFPSDDEAKSSVDQSFNASSVRPLNPWFPVTFTHIFVQLDKTFDDIFQVKSGFTSKQL